MKTHADVPVVGVLMANTPSRNICCADKCMKKLMGRPILSYVVERTSPQVESLILNANGDPTRFSDMDLPVVPDSIDDHAGTLVAILTGMEWSQSNDPNSQWVATFATDAPFVPQDLVNHLLSEIERTGADMAYVKCGKRAHPEFGLWPVELAEDLRYSIEEEDIRRVDKWSGLYNTLVVDYAPDPIDYFTGDNSIEGIIDLQHKTSLH